jgi:hypothetical protein
MLIVFDEPSDLRGRRGCRRIEHGAHRTTGDNTGTGGGRAQEHDTGSGLTLHRVRDGRAGARHAEEVALGLFDTLGDGEGNLTRLAVADADETVAVAHDDERREAEAATALDDLRHAVDRDDALEELALLGVARTTVAAPAALATAATGLAGLAPAAAVRGLLGHFVLDILSSCSLTGSGLSSRAPSAIAATRPA